MTSEINLDIDVKGFKCKMGSVDKKTRPTCLYFVIESDIYPKLSIVKARTDSINRPKDLASSIIKEFISLLNDYGAKKLGSFFDPEFFDPNSVIYFVSNIYPVEPLIGSKQKFSFEINIDTMNSKDPNGDPKISRDGKLYNYNFKDFEEPAKKAIEQLLSTELFSRNSLIKFGK